MSDHPSPEELGAVARGLDERQGKIVVATIAHMIEHSHRVRDREWVSETFAHTVAIAFADEERAKGTTAPAATSDDVARVQAYAQEQAPVLLPLAFGIFGQVALTLQRRGGPITAEAAMTEVLSYLG